MCQNAQATRHGVSNYPSKIDLETVGTFQSEMPKKTEHHSGDVW